MRLYNRKQTWTSTITFAAVLVGCTLETVPIGENDAPGTGSKGSVDEGDGDTEGGTGAAVGTGAAGGTGNNDVPASGGTDYGSGAAGGDGDSPAGTGAAVGTGAASGDGDSPASSGAYGGTDADSNDGTGATGGDPDRINPLVVDYCEMEAACIPTCMIEDGVAPCGAPERQDECLQIELPMSTACELAEAMWMGCMAELSCAKVELFFAHHPDGFKESTPCGEYVDLFCDDWEPPTEYAFE